MSYAKYLGATLFGGAVAYGISRFNRSFYALDKIPSKSARPILGQWRLPTLSSRPVTWAPRASLATEARKGQGRGATGRSLSSRRLPTHAKSPGTSLDAVRHTYATDDAPI
eukprot:3867952-Pyramimonas_sp.AAC.2